MTEDENQPVHQRATENSAGEPSEPRRGENGGDEQHESDTVVQDIAADTASGVADQDPLSAHPS